MSWSISLCRAEGGFFSVGFGVVGAVGGSTGFEASNDVMCVFVRRVPTVSALAWEGLCLVLALVAFVLE